VRVRVRVRVRPCACVRVRVRVCYHSFTYFTPYCAQSVRASLCLCAGASAGECAGAGAVRVRVRVRVCYHSFTYCAHK